METVCQVAFNLMTGPECLRAEQVLREYLLRAGEQVSLTRVGSSYLSFFKIIPHRIKYKKFLGLLKEGDVQEKNEHRWIFNLTENIKSLFNEATLFDPHKIFYGFADPKFLKNGHEIASMISNEKIVSLHISDSDKASLADQGVYVDSPEI
jgi:hypothetical protein